VCVDGLRIGLRTVRAIPEPEIGSRVVRGSVSTGAKQQALSFRTPPTVNQGFC
jgi:hypothetical protein